MRNLLLAGAAAMSIAGMSTAAVAQDASAPMGSTNTVEDKQGGIEMTAEQQAEYDSWPEEQQVMFVAWEPVYQEYYWTLTPTQKEGYWVLNDEQRMQINQMTPAQRSAAWSAITSQIDEATSPAAQSATTSAEPGTPAATTPKDYPICSAEVQDSCIQPRAAGKNYGNRPLDYWPGEPASKMN